MNRSLGTTGLSCACLMAMGPMAPAVMVSLPVVADNTLYESPSGDLSNGAGQYLFVGNAGGGGGTLARRALIRFDVVSILPAGATVDSVSLRLFMDRTISGAQDISLHRVTRAWGEGTSDAADPEGSGAVSTPGDATWVDAVRGTDLWTNPGGDFAPGASATTAVNDNGSYTWSGGSLVADAQDMRDNPGSDFGWVMIGNEAASRTAKRFFAREVGEQEATLTIEYTPIPEPGVTSALALGAFACLRRHRRS